MIISALLKVLGYAEKLILAYYYGTGPSVDVFLLVSGIVFSLFVLFRELIEPGFLNIFLKIRHKDEDEAWRFFNTYGRILFIPVLAVFLAGIIFPGKVIDIFAPGFTADKRQLAIQLVQIAFPAVIFMSMSNLTAITLNGLKQFVLPAAGDIIFRMATLLFLIVLYPKYGILGAGIGLVAGAAGKLLLHLGALWRRVSFKSSHTDPAHYKALWKLTWPLLLGMLFSQTNLLVDNMFASYMQDGTIAALAYAKKIAEMPVIVFPYVLSIVVFPYFSQFAVEQNTQRLTSLYHNTTGWIIFIFLPLAVLSFTFAHQLTSILLERGAFNAASTALTARPLAIYSLGMVSFALETIIVLVFFSVADTRTPIITGIICVVINILITILLIPHIGYLAIAVALVISKTLKISILSYLLRKRITTAWQKVKPFLTKVLLATLVLAAYLIIARYLLQTRRLIPVLAGSKALFLFCSSTGIIVYLATCYFLRMKPYFKNSLSQEES